MTTELIIFSAILVVSVILHLFFWLNSKKRYKDYMKRQEALNKRIEQLEASNEEMDRVLDDAEDAMARIDEGIEDLRSGRYRTRKRPLLDN